MTNVVVPLQTQVSGHISVQVLNAQGQVVREVPEFRNLITNAGLDYLLGNTDNFMNMSFQCKVGTGAGTPAVGDTVLPGYLASAGRTSAVAAFQTTTPPYYFEGSYTYLFALGAVVGTLTCIGVSNVSGSGVLAWSQVKDSGDSPTTITVLAGEQLSVTYKFRSYAPPATTVGSMDISGDAVHGYTLYAHSYGNGGFGLVNGSCKLTPDNIQAQSWTSVTLPATLFAIPTFVGNSAANFSMSFAAYTPGSYVRNMTGTLSTTVNVTGNDIEGLNLYGIVGDGPKYLLVLDTPIPKDNTKTLSLTFQNSIARYP